MKIDIIIPAYNAIDTIDTPLASIKKQKNVADLHVCIVNDGSDYSYQSIIKKYSPFFDIEEVSLPKNVGPGEARNQGILHTQQDYLLFLDADDVLVPDAIETLNLGLLKNEGAVIALGMAEEFISEELDSKSASRLSKKEVPFGAFLSGCCFGKKEAFLEVGFFDTVLNKSL